MKTKVNVVVKYKVQDGKTSVSATLVLPKLNYVEGSGNLRHTKIDLDYDARLTPDDLDLMVSERSDFKIVPNREITVACDAEGYKQFYENGTAKYWVVVTFSEHVKRPFSFSRTQRLNFANCKYPVEFEEYNGEDKTVVLPLEEQSKKPEE